MDKKAIISWQPKRDGANGMFTTRVNESKKGAVNYSGTLATGKTYNYWAYPVKAVKGRIVWIDKLQTNFGFKFVFTLQGANGNLNCIETPFATGNVKDICNRLLGIHKGNGDKWDWLEKEYTVAYWVFKKKKNGVPVVENGVQQYQANMTIEDADGYYTKDNPMPEKYKWVQQLNGAGKMEWNSIEELKFWEQFILGIQKALILNNWATPILPQFYTSLLCGAVTNPTGIEQASEMVTAAQAAWDKVKANYKFSFQQDGTETTSDDFSLDDDAGGIDETLMQQHGQSIDFTKADAQNNVVVPNVVVPLDISEIDDSGDDLGLPF